MTRPAPLFADHLPKHRKSITEFPTGCRVAFDHMTHNLTGRVIATLPKYQWVVIISKDARIYRRSPADIRRID